MSILKHNTSLLAYYPMTRHTMDLTGNICYDMSGNARHGTITPGASAGLVKDMLGRSGMAYDFDGANTKIDCNSDFIGVQAITVSAWIKAESYGESNVGTIVFNEKFRFFVISNIYGGLYQLWFASNVSPYVASASNSILLNKWYHVVVTRSAAATANANLYVDGALSGPANQNSGTPTAGTTNVIIGNNSVQQNTFDGPICELAIWSRVMGLEEIKTLHRPYALMNYRGKS